MTRGVASASSGHLLSNHTYWSCTSTSVQWPRPRKLHEMQPEQPTEPNEAKLTPKEHEKPKPAATEPRKSNTEPVLKQYQGIDRFSVVRGPGRFGRTILTVLFGLALWSELYPFFARGFFVGPIFVVPAVVATCVFAYLVISASRFGSTFDIAMALLFALSSVIAMFSVLYWNYGTTNNFSANLTQLDAIYFSVGTLSTAGTGNISAISETARGLQTLQMILDIVLIVFAVSLAVAEISSRMHNKRL